MRPITYSSVALAREFKKHKVLTKAQIVDIMGCSAMTMWRLLKELGYRTSYNCNARYYTLVDIPTYDRHGLWSYRTIRFSTHGSLPATVKALVMNSHSGLTMGDLRDMLQVKVTPTLVSLHKREEISRKKVGPVYRYLSHDHSLNREQLIRHEKEQKNHQAREVLPEPERIIAVFVELIKTCDLEADQVLRRLRYKGIPMTKDELRRIWSSYDLAKKKRL